MEIVLWSMLSKLPQTIFHISNNGSLLINKMNIESTVWKMQDGNKQIQKFTEKLIGYDTIS